jgi:hypothetical protein
MVKRYPGKENRERKKQKILSLLKDELAESSKKLSEGKILKTKEKTVYICAWICRTIVESFFGWRRVGVDK